MSRKQKIDIITKTPVHVGIGENLKYGSEWAFFNKQIGVFQEIKCLNQLKELSSSGDNSEVMVITEWTNSILSPNSGLNPLLGYVHENPGNLDKISSRMILMQSEESEFSDFLPQYHTYSKELKWLCGIPGSSIKGSISTAILNQSLNYNISTKSQFDEEVIRIFGKNPLLNILRFFQIRQDVLFDEPSEAVIVGCFNDGKWTDKYNQWWEVIPCGRRSAFSINLNSVSKEAILLHNRLRDQNRINIGNPVFLKSIEGLFRLINKFTRSHLENEFKWAKDFLSSDDQILRYKKVLDEFMHEYTEEFYSGNSSPQKCLLRLGGGTGFQNITGGWQEKLMTDSFYNDFKHKRRDDAYRNFIFPKTKRMLSDGTPLGFVELSLPQTVDA